VTFRLKSVEPNFQEAFMRILRPLPALLAAMILLAHSLAAAQDQADRRRMMMGEALCADIIALEGQAQTGCVADLQTDKAGTVILEPKGFNAPDGLPLDAAIAAIQPGAIAAGRRGLDVGIVVFLRKVPEARYLKISPALAARIRTEGTAKARALALAEGQLCISRGWANEPDCKPIR
jgi:hypothetical protein